MNLTVYPVTRDKLLPCEQPPSSCGSLAKFTVIFAQDKKETEQNLCQAHAIDAVHTAMARMVGLI